MNSMKFHNNSTMSQNMTASQIQLFKGEDIHHIKQKPYNGFLFNQKNYEKDSSIHSSQSPELK